MALRFMPSLLCAAPAPPAALLCAVAPPAAVATAAAAPQLCTPPCARASATSGRPAPAAEAQRGLGRAFWPPASGCTRNNAAPAMGGNAVSAIPPGCSRSLCGSRRTAFPPSAPRRSSRSAGRAERCWGHGQSARSLPAQHRQACLRWYLKGREGAPCLARSSWKNNLDNLWRQGASGAEGSAPRSSRDYRSVT